MEFGEHFTTETICPETICPTPTAPNLTDSTSSGQETPHSQTKAGTNSEKKQKTRRATELFGLGPAICADDATITGIRLPTSLQVLRCMMYHCNVTSHSERQGSLGAPSRFTTAKMVLDQVKTFYDKANIPMVTERRACEKIVKLLDDNNKLRSIEKKRRDTPATKRKLDEHFITHTPVMHPSIRMHTF